MAKYFPRQLLYRLRNEIPLQRLIVDHLNWPHHRKRPAEPLLTLGVPWKGIESFPFPRRTLWDANEFLVRRPYGVNASRDFGLAI
jgi:hypothetical protein